MAKHNISVLIKRASLHYDKVANQQLVTFDLTNSQFKVLKYLYHHRQNQVTQKNLEDYFAMTNPTVTGIVQNLEKKHLITRHTNPKDARSKLLKLTEHALDLENVMIQVGKKIDDTFTQSLNTSQKEQLLNLLQTILEGADDANTN